MVPAREFQPGADGYSRLMAPTEFVREFLPFAPAIALFALPIVFVVLAALRLSRRRIPRWLIAVAAICIAVWLGYALLASEDPPWVRAVALLGIVLLVTGISLRGWVDAAGLVLIAAALPWLAYAAAWLLDGLIAGRRIDAARALPPFVTSVVAIAFGIAFVRFHRQYTARHPKPEPPAEPATRRWDAVARAIQGADLFGLTPPTGSAIVVLIVGTMISVTIAHGRPILETIVIVIVAAVATGLAATLAWTVVRSRRSRRAFEAFVWLAEWELARFGELIGGPAPITIAGMKRYVRNYTERAEDRWIRADILAATGDLAGARVMAARIPDDTPYGRVERIAAMSYVDWLSGGPSNTARVREAAEAIQPADSDERFRAEVAVAAAEVRDRIAAEDEDPAAPLRAVRDRLGRRADRVLLQAARRVARSYLLTAGAFVTIFILLDHTTTP
jgi:hypothetical protein